jgi:hypothetical protein
MSRWIRIACDLSHPAEFFWRAYERLNGPHRLAARRSYAIFAESPDHPSLRFKKLGDYEHLCSVRINEQYSAVGERRSETIVRFWLGTHNEFDNLFV